jgi:pimeloyl-ACP methyl ester carboxylesterase
MVAALQRYRATMGASQVTLIGYSGGGTLAWLMAKEMKEVTAVITIAANLDVELWTSLHGYTPLTDSLNPAALPPLPERIRQIHFVGGRDRNVPPRVPRSFAVRHPSATIIQVPEFDHTCCWVKEWPALLQSAERESYHR